MKKKLLPILFLLSVFFCFPAAASALSDVTVQADDPLTAVSIEGTALPEVWATIKITDKENTILYFGSKKTSADAKYKFTVDVSGAALPLDMTVTYGAVVETAQIKLASSGGGGFGGGGGGGTEVLPPDPVEPIPPEIPAFEDIEGHWAESTILYLAEKGIVTGKSETRFDPQGNVTRAEYLAMLIRAAGVQINAEESSGVSFSDVVSGSWYAPYVNWAAQRGIAKGYGDGTFGPGNLVTREQMAAMTKRLAEVCNIALPPVNGELTFKDEEDIASWARADISAVQRAGIILGNADGSFRPKDNGTRAEAAAIVKRLYDLV